MKSSSASTILISLFLFLSFTSPLSALKPKCHPQDQKAINKIKAAFGINPTGDCCYWEFVVCDNVPPYRVTALIIADTNNISGHIPAAVGDLSFLRHFTISNVSNIIGIIPPAVTKITTLVSIIISLTRVTGPIPSFPVNLNSLDVMDLSFNALTGSIPPELSRRAPNLSFLNLRRNRLTGTIPESFGNFSNNTMETIFLSRNFLTGTIPKSLSNLNLYFVDLSWNNFIGDASLFLGKNKRTLNLYLQRNNFTFDLSNVEFPQNLKEISLSNNNIFGSLPQQLTQLKYLVKFHVSYNKLCGEIPQGGSLQQFKIGAYIHNQCLCGSPLPACV